MKDIKKLLEIRKERKRTMPKFRRQTYGIYKRIGDEWRKPKGRHSKQKHQMAGHSKKVKPGFRTNRIVRGMDRTGLVPIVVYSLGNIPLIDKNLQGAIISSNVGDRKRIVLLNELKKHGIKVLNLKEGHENKILEKIKQRKQERENKILKKKEGKPKKEEKKAEKELTPEEKEAQEKKEKDKLLTKEQK